jgi:hypothetical protein
MAGMPDGIWEVMILDIRGKEVESRQRESAEVC